MLQHLKIIKILKAAKSYPDPHRFWLEFEPKDENEFAIGKSLLVPITLEALFTLELSSKPQAKKPIK